MNRRSMLALLGLTVLGGVRPTKAHADGGAPPPSKRTLTVMFVGDRTVGKTCLIVRHVMNTFSSSYVPTTAGGYSVDVMTDGGSVMLSILDTGAGALPLDARRRMYLSAHVIVPVYSVISTSSFANITKVWLPEIRQEAPRAKVLLVGAKLDLRTDAEVLERLRASGSQPITTAEGAALAKAQQLGGFVECSALTRSGVKTVFDEIVRAGLVAGLVASPRAAP